jgi:hypothetical protein
MVRKKKPHERHAFVADACWFSARATRVYCNTILRVKRWQCQPDHRAIVVSERGGWIEDGFLQDAFSVVAEFMVRACGFYKMTSVW